VVARYAAASGWRDGIDPELSPLSRLRARFQAMADCADRAASAVRQPLPVRERGAADIRHRGPRGRRDRGRAGGGGAVGPTRRVRRPCPPRRRTSSTSPTSVATRCGTTSAPAASDDAGILRRRDRTAGGERREVGGLRATFPPEMASHSTVQDFYFGEDHLLRRHDYHVASCRQAERGRDGSARDRRGIDRAARAGEQRRRADRGRLGPAGGGPSAGERRAVRRSGGGGPGVHGRRGHGGGQRAVPLPGRLGLPGRGHRRHIARVGRPAGLARRRGRRRGPRRCHCRGRAAGVALAGRELAAHAQCRRGVPDNVRAVRRRTLSRRRSVLPAPRRLLARCRRCGVRTVTTSTSCSAPVPVSSTRRYLRWPMSSSSGRAGDRSRRRVGHQRSGGSFTSGPSRSTPAVRCSAGRAPREGRHWNRAGQPRSLGRGCSTRSLGRRPARSRR
jgi:hypothetical protein